MCKNILIFSMVLVSIYASISIYCIISSHGESIRHLERLGRGYGMDLIAKCNDDKNYKSVAVENYFASDKVDNYWYGYKFIVKEGIRPADIPKKTVIAAFLPTKSLPWWIWLRPTNRILVCYSDLGVQAVLPGDVDFKL